MSPLLRHYHKQTLITGWIVHVPQDCQAIEDGVRRGRSTVGVHLSLLGQILGESAEQEVTDVPVLTQHALQLALFQLHTMPKLTQSLIVIGERTLI